MAHQYIAQLEETVRDAVFGNVGTIVTFRVGAADSIMLAPEFAPVFLEEDIVNLSKFNVFLKLMIDGVASQPFSAQTLAPIGSSTGSTEKVIRVSRERYGKARDSIEEKVLRWSGMEVEEGEGSAPKPALKPAQQAVSKPSAKPVLGSAKAVSKVPEKKNAPKEEAPGISISLTKLLPSVQAEDAKSASVLPTAPSSSAADVSIGPRDAVKQKPAPPQKASQQQADKASVQSNTEAPKKKRRRRKRKSEGSSGQVPPPSKSSEGSRAQKSDSSPQVVVPPANPVQPAPKKEAGSTKSASRNIPIQPGSIITFD